MIILQFRFLQYSFRVAHIRTNCDCIFFLFLVFLQFNHEIDTSIFDHAFVFVILINDVQVSEFPVKCVFFKITISINTFGQFFKRKYRKRNLL